MVDMIKEQYGFPVNSDGEIVAVIGTGGRSVAGSLPSDNIPVDANGNMVVNLQSADGGSVVTAKTNPVTGKKAFLIAGIETSVHDFAVGQKYTRVLLPLNQSGGASVLPTDYSGSAAACVFGASMGPSQLPWANAGYLTTYTAGGSSFAEIANAAINASLYTDSWVLGVTINKATPAGSDTIMGCLDGGAIPGPYFLINSTGKFGMRLFCNGATALSATYTAATVADGTDHRALVTFDAVTKVASIYVDGAVSFSGTVAAVLSTDVMTGALRLGQALSGSSIDCKFAGLEFLAFKASGLPINIAELAVSDNLHRRTGLLGEPVFL